jgi:hypothetical protein
MTATKEKLRKKLDARKKKVSTKHKAKAVNQLYATREQWLNAAALAVRPLFDEQGANEYPKVRLSCGWPKGGRGKTIGQAWHPESSGDATAEIFISPVLDEPVRVLDILIHELIHATVGNEAGHKGPFRKLAKAIGLEGKMTATHAGEELAAKLLALTGNLGPYPHAELSKSTTTKQGTRMIKVQCPACDYVIRTTQKWIDVGLPTCCCGTDMELPE